MAPTRRPSWAHADHRCSTCKGRRFGANSDMYFDFETQMWTRSCSVCLAKRRSKRGWDKRMVSKASSIVVDAGAPPARAAAASAAPPGQSPQTGDSPPLAAAGGAVRKRGTTKCSGYRAHRARRPRKPGAGHRSHSGGEEPVVRVRGTAAHDGADGASPRAKRRRKARESEQDPLSAVAVECSGHGPGARAVRVATHFMGARHESPVTDTGFNKWERAHTHRLVARGGRGNWGMGHAYAAAATWSYGAMDRAPEYAYYSLGAHGYSTPLPIYAWHSPAQDSNTRPWCPPLAPPHFLLQPTAAASTPCPSAYPYWRPQAAPTPGTPHTHWAGSWPAFPPPPPTPAPHAPQLAGAVPSPQAYRGGSAWPMPPLPHGGRERGL